MLRHRIAQFSYDANCGIVKHVVEATVFGKRVTHELSTFVCVRHVQLHGFSPTPRLYDAGSDFLCAFAIDIGNDYHRSSTAQLFAKRAAKTGRSAGDNGQLVFERLHARRTLRWFGRL
jgi:hypothetical protein